MTDSYASVAENYDIMIDWPTRLARERPFYAALFAEGAVHAVLDVGCGTGHHSRLFAELGASVLGLDPSGPMLARAQALTFGPDVRFMLGGFEELPEITERFDLVTVLGNTLAHVGDAAGLTAALRGMRGVLNPGGRLCAQVINYDSLRADGSHWLPIISRSVNGREYLFLREHRILGESAEFTLVTLIRDGAWEQQVERSRHLPLPGEMLYRAMREAGFANIALYGNFQREQYDPASSPSLIVIAEG